MEELIESRDNEAILIKRSFIDAWIAGLFLIVTCELYNVQFRKPMHCQFGASTKSVNSKVTVLEVLEPIEE